MLNRNVSQITQLKIKHSIPILPAVTFCTQNKQNSKSKITHKLPTLQYIFVRQFPLVSYESQTEGRASRRALFIQKVGPQATFPYTNPRPISEHSTNGTPGPRHVSMCVTHLEVIFASIGKREVGEQE